jgi:hypothetical protein
MAENDDIPQELPPLPRAPWATMLTALVFLFVFAGLVMIVLRSSENLDVSAPPQSGAKELEELRAQENEILNNRGYDPATKSWRMPIDQAMQVLIDEGKAKGEMQSFPVKGKK